MPGQMSLPMPYGTGRSLAISLLRSRGRVALWKCQLRDKYCCNLHAETSVN
jgi:hypothetical protein